MRNKSTSIYKITRGYRSCKVWHPANQDRRLAGTSTMTIDKGVTRRKSYEVIAQWLTDMGIAAPDYYPTKRETSKVGE